MGTLLCPVCRMMERSDFPADAAAVARPARKEWPPYFVGSSPTSVAQRCTTRATPS